MFKRSSQSQTSSSTCRTTKVGSGSAAMMIVGASGRSRPGRPLQTTIGQLFVKSMGSDCEGTLRVLFDGQQVFVWRGSFA
jgi:hypothetical protein